MKSIIILVLILVIILAVYILIFLAKKKAKEVTRDLFGTDDIRKAAQQMKQEYQAAGYQLPAVVYWNVCSRNRQFPVKKDDTGAVLVSGCSPFMFQSAVCMTTPEKYMQQVLEGERYCRISA